MGLHRAGVEKHQPKYSEYKYFMTVFVAVNLKVEKIISLRIILFSKHDTMTLNLTFSLKTPGD